MSEIRDPEWPPGEGGQSEPPLSTVEHLNEAECLVLLDEAGFGRLAMAVAGDLDVFPINFALDGGDIVFRTAEGTKLLESVITDLVVIEADGRDPAAGVAWSVVAKGTPELLQRFDSIYEAQRLDIRPWITDPPKEHFVRVRVHSISGRRFRASTDPCD